MSCDTLNCPGHTANSPSQELHHTMMQVNTSQGDHHNRSQAYCGPSACLCASIARILVDQNLIPAASQYILPTSLLLE